MYNSYYKNENAPTVHRAIIHNRTEAPLLGIEDKDRLSNSSVKDMMKDFFAADWIDVNHVYLCAKYYDKGTTTFSAKFNLPSDYNDDSSDRDSHHYKNKKRKLESKNMYK